jgi:gliding motility-associated-like protein
VIVSALNACNSIANFTLSANPLQLNTTVQNETCNNANGAIFTTVTGGNAPYRFLWSNGSSSANLQNIAAGNYTVNITDVNGCSLRSSNITISNTNSNVLVNLGADRSICPGQTIVLNAGLFSSYLWQDNSRNQTLPINSAGLYRVTVTDSLGCAGTDEVLVTEDCSGIYFPSAFTPNNDGRNDLFGPLGNLSALSNFKLSVYNRYGQQIFFSNNPFQKWDGQWSGKAADSNNFVWMASFDLNGISQQMKGTVILIQ